MQMTPYKIHRRHEADQKKTRGMYAFLDRGQHEADRGRHEAELWNEDIRYMRFPKGPNFAGSNRSLVNYVRWSVTFGAQSEVSEDTLDGEDAICPSRVRNKRPILRYFLAMMTM
ncbi:hypothetical protein T4D_13969 [Trichinella pseudospiralis]|uniref:Uncharacterized protein n=1 Tax=Trichinella pseudospiralis TaxID=6337 RepID=A0A0V1F306_TRIPS|nr:hypothetical protein T4D_13969 [Trichinella pseudospiralis]